MTNTWQRRIVLTEEQGRAVASGLRHGFSAAQNPRMSQRAIETPRQTGPCQFSELGAMVAVRCPHDYDSVMLKAGDSGNRDRVAGLSSGDAQGR
jgi:hypothetical protein